MLARCILASPSRGGRSHWRDTVRLVRARITKWRTGGWVSLWDEVTAENDRLTCRLQKIQSRPASQESLKSANSRRARRACEDGQFRKAIQSLSSVGLASPSGDVLEAMRSKHPSAPPPSPFSSPAPSPVQVSSVEVVKALRSFPSGSAPGPTCLRASHLMEAVFCPSPDRSSYALQGLVGVVNLLCRGCVAPSVRPHLCGATLLACQKKGGGLRPIAVGEVLRRLTSKCVSRAVHAESISALSPLQVGVGIPHGCEAIVHSVVSLLNDSTFPPDSRFLLLVDFSNAFNSTDRKCLFDEARSRIPSMSAWLECCYGSQPLLHLGKDTIFSCCGVQQGDPLGPLGFSLVLQPLLERIQQEAPGLLMNAWYLDDGTLCGSLSDLCTALDIIEAEGPSRGLHLNRGKSLLIVPPGASPSPSSLPAGVPTSDGGFVLLGCPIGPAAHCSSIAMERISRVQNTLLKLRDIQDCQMETSLLRSCLSLPKISFMLRTCAPHLILSALSAFDDIMRDTLADLCGSPISDWSWLKASLPVSMGGLNLRRALLHAPAAFVGSLCNSHSLITQILGHPPPVSVDLPSCLSALAGTAGRPEWVSLQEIDVPLRQRSLSHSIDEASLNLLLSSAPDSRSLALAHSCALPHAGDWLNAVPSSPLGLHLMDREFRVCLQYWLGVPIFEEGVRCGVCLSTADSFGDHQVGCGGNGDRILRHNSIRDAIFNSACSAALAPRKEVPSLIPGSQSRPADIYLPNWERGQPAALDVTVISPLQSLTLHRAASSAGHALTVGEQRKVAAHAAACHAVGVSFVPLVFETLGGMSELASTTVSRIGRLLGQRLGISPADTTRHLFQRCSISLWRGNAALWLRRFPTRPPSIDSIV